MDYIRETGHAIWHIKGSHHPSKLLLRLCSSGSRESVPSSLLFRREAERTHFSLPLLLLSLGGLVPLTAGFLDPCCARAFASCRRQVRHKQCLLLITVSNSYKCFCYNTKMLLLWVTSRTQLFLEGLVLLNKHPRAVMKLLGVAASKTSTTTIPSIPVVQAILVLGYQLSK